MLTRRAAPLLCLVVVFAGCALARPCIEWPCQDATQITTCERYPFGAEDSDLAVASDVHTLTTTCPEGSLLVGSEAYVCDASDPADVFTIGTVANCLPQGGFTRAEGMNGATVALFIVTGIVFFLLCVLSLGIKACMGDKRNMN